MMELSLLVVCVLFSCLALVSSLSAFHRTQKCARLERKYNTLYELAEVFWKEWQSKAVEMEGDVDRLKDRFELHLKAFTRFRSRVTMEKRREADSEQEQDDYIDNDRPWTEQQKNKMNVKLFEQRYGVRPPVSPQEDE